MDPGRLDAVDGADGAGEFAFQRAQMVDVLNEAGAAEGVGLVEDLVADAASLGTMITAPSLRNSYGIAWRSRSLMMPEESSVLRSVNRVVICGAVTRMMTNAKKPIRAAVTATIASNREAPSPFRKPTRLCKPTAPRDSARRADWAIIAYAMVSIWLTVVKGRGESSK
jgi:hypothetical protein